MKEWKSAELIVKSKLPGSRITPGSGNQRIRGDVIAPGKVVEVKQTEKDHITVQGEWFSTLLLQSTTKDIALALFFGLTGVIYYYQGLIKNTSVWHTKEVHLDNLPATITFNNSLWVLNTLDSLSEW